MKKNYLSFILFFLIIIILFCPFEFAIAQQPPPKCSDYLAQYIPIKQESRIFDSCDKEIVIAYTEYFYIPLNNHLRKYKLESACDQMAGELRASLKKIPPLAEPTVVYRGMSGIQKFKEIALGECFADLGFVSTSKSKMIALDFLVRYPQGRIKPSLLNIKTTTGKDITLISETTAEQEIVLLPNTTLKITNISLGGKYDVYDMLEVKPKNCLKIVQDLRETIE